MASTTMLQEHREKLLCINIKDKSDRTENNGTNLDERNNQGRGRMVYPFEDSPKKVKNQLTDNLEELARYKSRQQCPGNNNARLDQQVGNIPVRELEGNGVGLE